MKRNITFLFVLFALIQLGACHDDDKDTTAPTITVVTPTDEMEILPGSKIALKLNLEDNVELHQYKVDIHFNDGHEHKKSEGTEWRFQKTWTIDGKAQVNVDHSEIEIPTTVDGDAIRQGAYHFGIFVTDAAGNESHQFIEIHIEE